MQFARALHILRSGQHVVQLVRVFARDMESAVRAKYEASSLVNVGDTETSEAEHKNIHQQGVGNQ